MPSIPLQQTDPMASTSPLESRSANRPPTGYAEVSGDTPATVMEVDTKYHKWRHNRRPYEGQWFENSAQVRGFHNAQFSPLLNRLQVRSGPFRERARVNITLQKVAARISKFLKTRPLPVVTPASTDREDVMNARATEKVLVYLWRKLKLEDKYEDVLRWAFITGKAFWWFYWDQEALVTVKEPDGLTRRGEILDVPLGDVAVEVGTAFEVLVADQGCMRLRDQSEIMRCKIREVKEVEARYGEKAKGIIADASAEELFQYERQIAGLGAHSGASASDKDIEGLKTHVVVKELFVRPCAGYPKGRHIVVAGGKVLKDIPELPFGLWRRKENPYPAVEFSDLMCAGQFWPTTYVEQLAWVQKDYARSRSKVSEQVKAQAHPKVGIPNQAGVDPETLNNDAGQVFTYNLLPNMAPPQQWMIHPPNVSSDTWKILEWAQREADLITNLYPATVGAQGATSGFDTNLLQEAADSVHAPDIKRNEQSLEDAFFIMRRIAKIGYDVPRLIAITGRDNEPDVFEFSSEEIDEHANIRVETGSNLPHFLPARINTVKELYGSGLFGPQDDPNTQRKTLRMLNLGSMEEAQVTMHRDEEQARLENLQLLRGQPVEDPQPWERHDLHEEFHADMLKSPEFKRLAPEVKMASIRHWVLTVKWINPQNALQLASIFGFVDIAQQIIAEMQPPVPGAPAPGTPPPPPEGQPLPPEAGLDPSMGEALPPELLAAASAEQLPPEAPPVL